MLRRAIILTALGLAAAGLSGCGTSGYGTVHPDRLVVIPTARPSSGAALRTEDALICGARAEARALHRTLRVQRPRRAGAAAQIQVTNAVIDEKPGGALILPASANGLTAPVLSMQGAGIKVISLSLATTSPADAAHAGVDAVATLVSEVSAGNRDRDRPAPVRVHPPCALAR